MNVKKIVLGAIALSLVMASCGSKSSNPFGEVDNTPKEYPTKVLTGQNVQLETIRPVTIKGQEDTEIRPRIDGFIEKIYVDEGSVVKKDQPLFQINSPQTAQAVKTAEAAVKSAEAQVATAKLNVDRIRPLAEKGIVSNVQLETAENTYQTALAQKAQADAALFNAKETRRWATVTSPIDGVVGTIAYRTGSLVNSANMLTTVSSIGNVFAYFSMAETDYMDLLEKTEGKTIAEKINALPEVSLIMKDKTMYPEKGKIKTISGTVNVTTGTVNLRAEFPNPNGILKSGFSGNISIPRYLENALVIPQKATFTRQDKYLVYKVAGDSVVQTMISVLPTPDGKEYVVTSGLSSGDRIVEDGIITLSNGKKIIAK